MVDRTVHAVFSYLMSQPQKTRSRMRLKILLALLVLGLTGHAYAETPYLAPYHWALKWLLAPLVVAAVIYTSRQRKEQSWIKLMLTAAAIVTTGMISGSGYANVINTWISSPKQVMIEGTITGKSESLGLTGTTRKVHLQSKTGAQTSVMVATDEFNQLNVGDIYRRSMTEGLLGFPFRRQ